MTFKTFTAITEALAAVFADLDATFTAESIAWAKDRAQAIRDFKASEEARTMRRDQAAYYGRLFQIAGGKTWYNLIDGRSMDQVAEVAAKNAAGVIEARNARIAAKLEAAGITAVTGQNIARTKDGFDGFFNVKTDKGDRVVTVSTIYAGGYNIQCFHQRTLVKVK